MATLLVAGTITTILIVLPDLPGALWTRAHYSQEKRLIDSTQYIHTVPIVSHHGHDTRSTDRIAEEIVVTDASLALERFARETSSNIVVINRQRQILFETYHAKPDADSAMLTNSMSMAKTLVALLVGIAIDKGVIHSVDEPIGTLLEELDSDSRGTITVRNLLQMESGLASQDSGYPLTNLQSMYFGSSPDKRALSVPSIRPPGVYFDYNSVNTQLLLIILKRAFGEDFEALLSRFIWSPLALDDGFGWRASENGNAKGFCCVFATARAWAEIGGILLQVDERREGGALVVSPIWVKEMMTPSPRTPNYGYQVYLGTENNGEVPFAAMSGTPQQVVVAFPSLGIAAVRVGNEHPRFLAGEFRTGVLQLSATIGHAMPR